MSHARIAMIAGATGAVGSRLLHRLLTQADGPRVIAVARREAPLAESRLVWIRAELSELPGALSGHACTEAFCCLGTTMRQAGSRAAFRAVDVDGVLSFARAARAGGAGFFGLVSAAGAGPGAPGFYLRTKGEVEQAVEALGFPSLAIMQPGLLRGEREAFRLAERLASFAAPLTDRLLLGGLARYRSVGTDTVAAALAAAAALSRPGVTRYAPAEIEALARGR
jgi:uncharacterized protein YbjT (DUF2867 family)